MALLLCVGSMLGQTASKLIEKYRQLPKAQYTDTSKETLKFYDENPDPSLTEKERAQMKKNFKMSEMVQIEKCDDELRAQIDKDIQALKGYEMLFITNKNEGADEGQNVLQQMMSETFNPTIKLQCYGKVKGNKVSDVLMRVDIWETVALLHLDTKVEKELMIKSIMDKEGLSFEPDDSDDNVVDMKEMVEEVKNGNVLIVINGQEYPELHSTKEADEWMRAQDISWNHETWVVGGAVKEKYPHTDKKVVIEFTREDKK
jgi:hypothetical protein